MSSSGTYCHMFNNMWQIHIWSFLVLFGCLQHLYRNCRSRRATDCSTVSVCGVGVYVLCAVKHRRFLSIFATCCGVSVAGWSAPSPAVETSARPDCPRNKNFTFSPPIRLCAANGWRPSRTPVSIQKLQPCWWPGFTACECAAITSEIRIISEGRGIITLRWGEAPSRHCSRGRSRSQRLYRQHLCPSNR